MTVLIRLVAADDHLLFLEGIKSLFKLTEDFNLLDSCENGDLLLSLIEEHEPDVALIDLSMPGASTEEIINFVEKNNYKTQLIALTMHQEPELAEELLSLGLSGYVLKEEAFDELSIAIRAVISGDQFISPHLAKSISKYHLESNNKKELLTAREIEVLEYASKGQGNKEIARSMDISERTVRFHVSNCCVKLDAKGRSHAVALSIQMSLISNKHT